MTSTFKRGFTLVELLVVMGMLAIIMGAITTSVSDARERAKIQKATVEVKAITQAVLAYENYSNDGLPILGSGREGAIVNASNLGFLLGKGGTTRSGDKIPVILAAALTTGGEVRDPWNRPYRIVIAKGKVYSQGVSQLRTGFSLPNIHRLSEEERK